MGSTIASLIEEGLRFSESPSPNSSPDPSPVSPRSGRLPSLYVDGKGENGEATGRMAGKDSLDTPSTSSNRRSPPLGGTLKSSAEGRNTPMGGAPDGRKSPLGAPEYYVEGRKSPGEVGGNGQPPLRKLMMFRSGWMPPDTGDSAVEDEDPQEEPDIDYTQTTVCSQAVQYRLRHPYTRLFVTFSVIAINFMLYAEDPQAHSQVKVSIPILGNDINLLLAHWPNSAGLCGLKIFMGIVGLLSGCLIGLFLVHNLCLRKWMRCQAFGYPKRLKPDADLSLYKPGELAVVEGMACKPQVVGEPGKGNWFIMAMTTIVTTYISALLYNSMVDTEDQFTATVPITNETFYKMCASGMWIATSVTVVFVFDMMAQDLRRYPHVLSRARHHWTTSCGGWLRIHLTWSLLLSLTVVVLSIVITDPNNFWDDWVGTFDGTDEVGRVAFAAFITIMDLLVIMQDWEFPTFRSKNNVFIPGLRVSNIHCPTLHIFITGKWFNYSIMFFVLVIDTMMLRNLFFYSPQDCGQYTDPEDHIWTVMSPEGYHVYTWEERQGCCGDTKVEARYTYAPSINKAFALIPCLAVLALLFHMIKTGLAGNGGGCCKRKPGVEVDAAAFEDPSGTTGPPSIDPPAMLSPQERLSQMLSPRNRTYSQLPGSSSQDNLQLDSTAKLGPRGPGNGNQNSSSAAVDDVDVEMDHMDAVMDALGNTSVSNGGSVMEGDGKEHVHAGAACLKV